jgi:peptidoglycan/LPS O-acetylase OafA/YrhL
LKNQISSLEGLRGVAALLVIVYHMQFDLPGLGATKNGYLAVDLFFVLSGFVICSAYGTRLSGAPQWWNFVIRRFGRLWPVHFATTILFYVTLNAMLALLMGAHTSEIHFMLPTVNEVLGLAFMVQGLNIFDHYVGTAVNWSTSDEFYVYLLFGVLCLMVRGRARISAFAALALAGYSLAIWSSVGLNECLTRGACLNMTYSYGWTRCVAGFFAGALITGYRDRSPLRLLASPKGQVYTFAAALLFVLFADRVPGIALAAPLVFVALVASLTGDCGPVARLFRCRAAQYLGKVSYSLYLGHAVFRPPLAVAGKVVTGMVGQVLTGAMFMFASFALAHILYRLVEMRFRQCIYAWSDAAFRSPENPPEIAEDAPASIV